MARLALLPPFVIARLGSAAEPLVNYQVELKDSGSGEPRRHQLVPAETIFVERETGRVTEIREATEAELTFKDGAKKIRPLAPFLEVWVQFDGEDTLRLLTQDDVDAKQLTVSWDIELGNWKAARRTNDEGDRVTGRLQMHPHTTGQPTEILGRADHFLPGATLSMGHFQCLLTDDNHRGIRARFIPPKGLIYGPRNTGDDRVKPVLSSDSPWTSYRDPDNLANAFPPPAIPVRTFAGGSDSVSGRSRGFLDDTSDGIVTVTVTGEGVNLVSKARISVGPPDFAPDRLPFRTLADDFEFFENGPEVEDTVPDEYVVGLVEHALDSAELLQLNRSRSQSGWTGNNIPYGPNDARETHEFLLSDGRELVDDNNAVGLFRNRDAFLRHIRPPASETAASLMPLFMVGQNRGPLFLNARQYAKLTKWATQEPGEQPQPPSGDEDPVAIDPAEARQAMLDLIVKKRDDDNAARRHRRIRIDENDRRLSDLFDTPEELLTYLQTSDAVRNTIPDLSEQKLVVPGNPSKSVLYRLIVDDDGPMHFEFEDDEIRVIERWIMSLAQ